MPDFAFRTFGNPNHPDNHPSDDNDVLASRGEASRLRDHLKAAGHDARVERGIGPNSEHRVWIQHPKYKDTMAYVTRGDVPKLAKGEEPYWVGKR